MKLYSWSDGKKYLKSAVKDKPIDLSQTNNYGSTEKSEPIKTEEQLESNKIFEDIEFKVSNKRELANNKLNDRMLMGQTNKNPFMTNNNYIQDLALQHEFLIPKNSNISKE